MVRHKREKTFFSSMNKPILAFRYGLLVAIIIFLVDQIIKWYTQTLSLGESITLIPHILSLTYTTNTGVAFGLFQGNNVLFIWISIMIFGLLIYWYDEFDTKLSSTAFWLIIAGLFGNLLDRLVHGHVIDMFDLGWFPIFNVADAAISVAVVLLIVNEIWSYKK